MKNESIQLYWLLRIHGSEEHGYRLSYSHYSGTIHAQCSMTVTNEHPWHGFIRWVEVNPPKGAIMSNHDTVERLVSAFHSISNPSWPLLLEKIGTAKDNPQLA